MHASRHPGRPLLPCQACRARRSVAVTLEGLGAEGGGAEGERNMRPLNRSPPPPLPPPPPPAPLPLAVTSCTSPRCASSTGTEAPTTCRQSSTLPLTCWSQRRRRPWPEPAAPAAPRAAPHPAPAAAACLPSSALPARSLAAFGLLPRPLLCGTPLLLVTLPSVTHAAPRRCAASPGSRGTGGLCIECCCRQRTGTGAWYQESMPNPPPARLEPPTSRRSIAARPVAASSSHAWPLHSASNCWRNCSMNAWRPSAAARPAAVRISSFSLSSFSGKWFICRARVAQTKRRVALQATGGVRRWLVASGCAATECARGAAERVSPPAACAAPTHLVVVSARRCRLVCAIIMQAGATQYLTGQCITSQSVPSSAAAVPPCPCTPLS